MFYSDLTPISQSCCADLLGRAVIPAREYNTDDFQDDERRAALASECADNLQDNIDALAYFAQRLARSYGEKFVDYPDADEIETAVDAARVIVADALALLAALEKESEAGCIPLF